MHPKVLSVLKSCECNHEICPHPEGVCTAEEFANRIGVDVLSVAKTVFCKTKDGRFFAAVCPTNAKLNMEGLAKIMASKSVRIASEEELNAVTGYPKYGTSPFGLENVPVFVDSNLSDFEYVYVGCGEVGADLKVRLADLVQLTGATIHPISGGQTKPAKS